MGQPLAMLEPHVSMRDTLTKLPADAQIALRDDGGLRVCDAHIADVWFIGECAHCLRQQLNALKPFEGESGSITMFTEIAEFMNDNNGPYVSSDNSITTEGRRLVEAWTNARRRVTQCNLQLADAEKIERETEAALAKWLAPSDAKPGEKIAVWYGDSLIQVEVGGVITGEGALAQHQTSTRVTIRTRGKHGREGGL